ncbi:MAG TPA: hypothetical protein VI685_06180 [Candidatus Angelobacter sp.]
MAARQSSPVIGDLCADGNGREAQARENLKTHHFDITIGYRYQSSARHFVGTVEQVQREILHTQIENDYHLFDVAINYELSPRWSLTASLPILVAKRDQRGSGIYHVAGIGDSTVGARLWIFRPPTESGGNISFGFSLKMPTGKDNSVDHRGPGGPLVTADQSIQAGDGGWGFALETQAFKQTFFHSTLYFSGAYLFNPEDTNGVKTFRSAPGEEVMSVADQYLYRGGISHHVPRVRGLFASIGGRMEGVPVRDAFGRSDGFRRPGYAIDVDPGFMYVVGTRNIFSCNVPFAVERNRRASVPDLAHNRHGDAAFADYALILSYNRHF